MSHSATAVARVQEQGQPVLARPHDDDLALRQQ